MKEIELDIDTYLKLLSSTSQNCPISKYKLLDDKKTEYNENDIYLKKDKILQVSLKQLTQKTLYLRAETW
jgi:hypothetical protein